MIGAKCYSESNSLNYLVLLAGVSNFYFCMLDTGDLIVPANCIANPEKKESGKKVTKLDNVETIAVRFTICFLSDMMTTL